MCQLYRMGATTIHIFKGSVHIEGWYQEPKLPPNWKIEILMDGLQMKLDYTGFKKSLFQSLITA